MMTTRRSCVGQQRLSQLTFLAMIVDVSKTNEFFASMSLDEWQIVSFEPRTREVCIEIFATNVLVTVYLPELVWAN